MSIDMTTGVGKKFEQRGTTTFAACEMPGPRQPSGGRGGADSHRGHAYGRRSGKLKRLGVVTHESAHPAFPATMPPCQPQQAIECPFPLVCSHCCQTQRGSVPRWAMPFSPKLAQRGEQLDLLVSCPLQCFPIASEPRCLSPS